MPPIGLATCSFSVGGVRLCLQFPAAFLAGMHLRSLDATRVQRQDVEDTRQKYKVLPTTFPSSTLNKVTPEQLSTDVGKAKASVRPVMKHACEIAELDCLLAG